MKSVGGLMDGCVPLPLKLEQSKKCILCPLFVILFNTAQSMSIVSYAQLAEGFKNLMLIGFALYIAYVTLKQVSSFTKQDGPKFVSELLVMSFKVLLAYLIFDSCFRTLPAGVGTVVECGNGIRRRLFVPQRQQQFGIFVHDLCGFNQHAGRGDHHKRLLQRSLVCQSQLLCHFGTAGTGGRHIDRQLADVRFAQ